MRSFSKSFSSRPWSPERHWCQTTAGPAADGHSHIHALHHSHVCVCVCACVCARTRMMCVSICMVCVCPWCVSVYMIWAWYVCCVCVCTCVCMVCIVCIVCVCVHVFICMVCAVYVRRVFVCMVCVVCGMCVHGVCCVWYVSVWMVCIVCACCVCVCAWCVYVHGIWCVCVLCWWCVCVHGVCMCVCVHGVCVGGGALGLPAGKNTEVNSSVPASQLWALQYSFPLTPGESQDTSERGTAPSHSPGPSQQWHRHTGSPYKHISGLNGWLKERSRKTLREQNTLGTSGWHYILSQTWIPTPRLSKIILFPNWKELNSLYAEQQALAQQELMLTWRRFFLSFFLGSRLFHAEATKDSLCQVSFPRMHMITNVSFPISSPTCFMPPFSCFYPVVTSAP